MEIREDLKSRDQTKDSATLSYFAFDEDNEFSEQEVILAVLDQAPLLYSNMYFVDYHYEEIKEDNTHRVEVEYRANSGAQKDRPTWRFATTGGTTKVKQAIQNIANYAPSGQTAPNYFGAIGVTKDSIEGVDIVTPNVSYSESHYKELGNLTAAYANTLALMTGCMNNASFRSWAAGEVLFVGATMSSQDSGGITIDYEFLLSPNATNINLGNGIVVAEKYGWDYLWCRYRPAVDEATGLIVEVPTSAHVDRVYKPVNFGSLLI